MKAGGKWLLVGMVALAAAWAGIETGRRSYAPQDIQKVSGSESSVAAQLLAMPLTTPTGETKRLAEWRGKILVVNFWATWCPPCRDEMPEFSRMQDQYGPNGVQFVGIAIDEAVNVVEFTKKTPVSYPLLMTAPDLPPVMAKLGNQQGGLPFTVIIARDGKPLFTHLGRVDGAELATQLKSLTK